MKNISLALLGLLISVTSFSQITFPSSTSGKNTLQSTKQPAICTNIKLDSIQLNSLNNNAQFRISEETGTNSDDWILLRSNSKFEVWGLGTEELAADTVIKVLTVNYDRVADSLNTQINEPIIVSVYADLSSYHTAMGWTNAADWSVGSAIGSTIINLVTPYNPGPVHSFSSIIGVITHELIHNFVHELANGITVPIWINEGSAGYLSYQTPSVNGICSYIENNGGKPSLDELNIGNDFAGIGGYPLSYTIVEFIVQDLGGSDKLSQFITSGDNYSILGYSDELSFQNAWHQFLDDNYSCASDDLTLTSPNGSNYYSPNDQISIGWGSTTITNVKLEYSDNNGSSWTEIVANTSASSGNYSWTVPNLTSNQCLIRISDASNPAVFDISDNSFEIGAPIIASGGGPYASDGNTILLMHFDGNLNEEASDYSVQAHGGAPSYIANPNSSLGNAHYFDNSNSGVQSYLSVPYSSELSLTANWTVEFWMYINSWDQNHNKWPVPILLPATGGNANYYLEVPASWGRLKYGFNSSNGGEQLLSSENSITTGVWYHVALINDYDNSSIKLILRDSEFQKLEEQSSTYTSGSTISTGTSDLKIGAGDYSDNRFDGYIDELRISNVVRDFSQPESGLPPLQFETDNIKFYASANDVDNWTTISQSVQNEFSELSSLWSRPGKTPLVPETSKVKIYLVDRASLLQIAETSLPNWKCAWYDASAYTIYVSIPEGSEQEDYYGSFEALAKGSLAQLMLKRQLMSTGNNSNRFDFFEGFGLYRGGYRPNRANILQAISDLGRLPTSTDIKDKTNLSSDYMKDLITSYIECQLLSRMAYYGVATWVGDDYWHPYIQNYFQKSEDENISLRKQSELFNIYSTVKDVQYLNAINDRLEEKLSAYSSKYTMDISHRYNIVVFPDEATGMACMNYFDYYNGGSGWGGDKLDILSPDYIDGGVNEVVYSLIPHEFFHIFHNHMAPPGTITAFHAEGMAEFMTYEDVLPERLQNNGAYIKNRLEAYEETNGHFPTLADFMGNSDGSLSIYTYGQAFWYYVHQNHADYNIIKAFFNNGSDWSVFDDSYAQIEASFLNFIRGIAGLSTINPPIVSDIPNQTINEGSSFSTIQLDDYVSDEDHSDSEITWTYSGDSELDVTINTSRIATISPPNSTWTGSETITFTATDPTNETNSDQVIFTVSEVVSPPSEATNPIPSNQAVTVSTSTGLNWTIDETAATVDLYFGTTNPPTSLLLSNATAVSTSSLNTLEGETEYFWKVVSRNSAGETASPIWSFTTGVVTGISKEDMILIYPNPTNNLLTISSPHRIDFHLLTLSGKKIVEIRNFQSGSIDVSGFQKGMYFVVFTDKKESIVKKIVIK